MKPRSVTTPPSALIEVYAERRARSVERVRDAIQKLEQQSHKITLAAIVAASNGSVSHTTILRNDECRALYEAASGDRRKGRRSRRHARNASETELRRARRLLRLPKDDLVEMILELEREGRRNEAANVVLRTEVLEFRLRAKGGQF